MQCKNWLDAAIITTLATGMAGALAQTASPAPAQGNEILHFSAATPQNSPHTALREDFVNHLCKRLQKRCVLRIYPPLRAEFMLRSGAIDGDVGRGEAYSELVPQAIRVPTKLSDISFVALSLTSNPRTQAINSWASLRDLNVVYIRGYKFVERHTEIAGLHPIDSYTACFGMVQASRVDACIMPQQLAQDMIADSKQDPKTFQTQILERGGLYMFLAKHRAHLVAEVDQAIQLMHKDGSLQAIYRKNFPDGKM